MKILRLKIVFLSMMFTLTSCLNNIDFDQLDGIIIKPVFTTSLVHFTVNQSDFSDTTGVITQLSITDISDFTIFESESVSKNLSKVSFDIRVRNEFPVDFKIKIQFLNENDAVVFSLTEINVLAEDLEYVYPRNSINVSTNQSLLSAKKIKIVIELPMGTSMLDPAENKKMEFKSAATYHIQTD
jgi:hypothetical protein